MTDKAYHPSDDHAPSAGSMDISAHVRTWHGFTVGVKWGVILLIALAVFLAIFRTHNG